MSAKDGFDDSKLESKEKVLMICKNCHGVGTAQHVVESSKRLKKTNASLSYVTHSMYVMAKKLLRNASA